MIENVVGPTSCAPSGICTTLERASTGAAVSCGDLDALGHQDWFLPAINELTVVASVAPLLSAFDDGFYWSSTEALLGTAVAGDVLAATGMQRNKAQAYPVRCVRRQP